MTRPPRKNGKRRNTHGEVALRDIEAITLKLEGGRRATFDIADELSVPQDPVALHEAALQGHSRYGFWSYQATRALGVLRRSERELSALEAKTYLVARQVIEEIRPKIPYVEAARVQAQVDNEIPVQEKREEVDSLREHWNMIVAVRDAMEHRSHLLRKLLSEDHNAATRG